MEHRQLAGFLFVSIYSDPDDHIEPSDAYNYAETFYYCCNDLISRLQILDDRAVEQLIQFEFYEAGKGGYGTSKQDLRRWFRDLYLLLFREHSGPRWGVFVKIIGINQFVYMIQNRLDDPFRLKS